MHILHLSDLHFGTQKDAQCWAGQLADDLKLEIGCNQVDSMIISGDISNNAIKEEYDAARIFIERICAEFKIPSASLAIVPGNHDLNWELSEDGYTPVKRKKYQGKLKEGSYIDESDALIQIRDDSVYEERFSPFSDFYEKTTGAPYPLAHDQQGMIYHLKDHELLILGLNSAWQADHHYRARAAICPDALSAALDKIRQNPNYTRCIKFAIWHHPLVSPFDDRIVDHGFMERLAQSGFSVCFHGHLHKPETGLFRYDHNAGGRKIEIVGAGTFGAPTKEWYPGYPLQYNLLEIAQKQMTVKTRSRIEINGAWRPHAIWSQGPGKDPLSSYTINLTRRPYKITKKKFKKTESIAPEIISNFDVLKYKEALKTCYRYLRLDSVHTSGYEYRLKLWNLFMWQNARKGIPPSDMPKEYQLKLELVEQLHVERNLEANRRDYDKIQKIEEEQTLSNKLIKQWESFTESPLKSIKDIVNDSNNRLLAILGDPGSGKSTLCQFICIEWAEGHSTLVPIIVELRKYVQYMDQLKDIVDYLINGKNVIYRIDEIQLDRYLNDLNTIIIFDGLDEVFDPCQRETVIAQIIRFSIEFPNVRIMVTSRIIGFSPKPFIDAGFQHFTLQDFEYSQQIKDFINKWYEFALPDPQEQQRLIDRLCEAINSSPAIRQLSGNPLLLSMMAILNRNQDLPRDRHEFYHQCSNVLIHNWDIEKNLPKDEKIEPDIITLKEKQALLRRIAYHIQTVTKNKSGSYIESEALENVIYNYLKSIEEIEKPKKLAKLIIQQLRERNFILCYWGADHYAFVHRTFLEYFCASEFLWQFEKTHSIGINDLKIEVFGKHWNNDSWHEVLRLIVGMINGKYAAELIEYIINIEGEQFNNIFLAAELLHEVKNRGPAKASSNKLFSLLKDIIHFSVLDSGDYDPFYVDGPYANMHFGEDITCRMIRSDAIKMIVKLWGNKKETEEWLMELSRTDSDNVKPDVIKTAAEQLKRLRKRGNPNIRTI